MSLMRPETTKDKLTLAGLVVGLLVGMGSLGAGVVNAVDFVQNLARKDEVSAQVQEVVDRGQEGLDAMEKRALKREILKLDLQDNPSNADKALRKQYQDDLEELQKKKGQR